jgi:hypothetical protein
MAGQCSDPVEAAQRRWTAVEYPRAPCSPSFRSYARFRPAAVAAYSGWDHLRWSIAVAARVLFETPAGTRGDKSPLSRRT